MSVSAFPYGVIKGPDAAGTETVVVTVGFFPQKGFSAYGYNRTVGPTGVCVPSTYKGDNINILWDTSLDTFIFQIAKDDPGATYISQIIVEDSGSPITMLAADATYATSGSTWSQWTWVSSTEGLDWFTGDSGLDRDVEIFA